MKFSAALCLAGASTIGAFAPNAFVGRSNTATSVAVGDSLPEIELFQGFPDPKKINLAEYAKDKNMIILSLPDELKEAGIEEVLVYCVNDPAVMQAWSHDQKTGPTMVNFMADPYCELTKSFDIELTHDGPHSVGIVGRSKRTAMQVIDGKIVNFAVAEGKDDPAGDADPSVTLAEAMLKGALKSAKKDSKKDAEVVA